jgi:hypothetical protein
VNKDALGEVFLPVIRGSPVSIINCLLSTRRHLPVSRTIKTIEPSPETFQKKQQFRKPGAYSLFPVFRVLIAEVLYVVPSAFSVSLYTALITK